MKLKSIYMKNILVFILLLFVVHNATAQQKSIWMPPQKDSLLVMLDHIYNLEFSSYKAMQSRYKEDYPRRPEADFVSAIAFWMQMLADIYNPKYDGVFVDKLDSLIDKMDVYDDDDPLYPVARFYIDAAIGFKAIMHISRQQWFSAALNGRKAIGSVEEALQMPTPYIDARFGTGLYLYFADIIPGIYPILKPLFLFYPNGDKKRGLSDLKNASENGIFSKVVSGYMYAQILLTRERRYKDAYDVMNILHKRYPQNPVFIALLARISTRLGKFSEARNLLDIYSKRVAAHLPYYPKHNLRMVNFRYANIYNRQNKSAQALPYFEKAMLPLENKLIDERLVRYKVFAALRSAYCLERLKRVDEAIDRFNLVLELKDFNKSHYWAEKHLKKIKGREEKKENKP